MASELHASDAGPLGSSFALPAHTAVLVVGHGSRREAANRQLVALAEACARNLGRPVRHAFLELAEPCIEDVLADLAARHDSVLVEPVFLFAAGHVKRDVPACVAMVAKQHPTSRIRLHGALGAHPNMVALAALRAGEALAAWQPHAPPELLVVGRGASDSGALAELDAVVRRLRGVHGFRRVHVAYADVSEPRFEDALDRLAKKAAAPLLVLPYLLFEGVLIDRLQRAVDQATRAHAGLDARLAAPLGAHPLLVELLAARVRARLLAARPSKTGHAVPSRA